MALSQDFFNHIIREWNYFTPPVLQIVSRSQISESGATILTELILTDGVHWLKSHYRNSVVWNHFHLEDFEVIRLRNWTVGVDLNNERILIIRELETVSTPENFVGNDVMIHAIHAAM